MFSENESGGRAEKRTNPEKHCEARAPAEVPVTQGKRQGCDGKKPESNGDRSGSLQVLAQILPAQPKIVRHDVIAGVAKSPKPELGKHPGGHQIKTGQTKGQNHSQSEGGTYLCELKPRNGPFGDGLPGEESTAEKTEPYSLLLHQKCQSVEQPAEKPGCRPVGFTGLPQKPGRRHREQNDKMVCMSRRSAHRRTHRHDSVTGTRHQAGGHP